MSNDGKNNTDICSSIHSADNIDPFEGLNLDSICVSPSKTDTKSSDQLFSLNPLDDIDLQDISVHPEIKPPPQQVLEDADITTIKTATQTHESVADSPLPLDTRNKNQLCPILDKAYHYAELTQVRQQVLANLRDRNGKTLLIASPFDNTGTSFLASALAYSTASSCQLNVLLIDCNMRRAGLHDFFSIPQPFGFTDIIQNNLPWQDVVKETGIPRLHIITAGTPVNNFSKHLRFGHIQQITQDVKKRYDIIILDTSPILTPNRNNVDIVSLTEVADYFLIVTKHAGTTKEHLQETKSIIEAGNGRIDGIVINEFTPEPKPNPF